MQIFHIDNVHILSPTIYFHVIGKDVKYKIHLWFSYNKLYQTHVYHVYCLKFRFNAAMLFAFQTILKESLSKVHECL